MVPDAVSILRPLPGVLVIVLLVSVQAFGLPQHGTAESGYYPLRYAGDTFAGAVTAVDDTSHEITLAYMDSKHNKTETFVGVLVSDYTARWKDGTEHLVKPSDIPVGTRMKVYYMTTERKNEGKKVKMNTIFLIQGVPNIKEQYSKFQIYK